MRKSRGTKYQQKRVDKQQRRWLGQREEERDGEKERVRESERVLCGQVMTRRQRSCVTRPSVLPRAAGQGRGEAVCVRGSGELPRLT
jgi:hypothetical protein